MQSTVNQTRPVLVFLSRPMTDLELKSVAERGFEVPLPQKPILDAHLSEDNLSWFMEQPFVGKVEMMPRNEAEVRAMAAAIESRAR